MTYLLIGLGIALLLLGAALIVADQRRRQGAPILPGENAAALPGHGEPAAPAQDDREDTVVAVAEEPGVPADGGTDELAREVAAAPRDDTDAVAAVDDSVAAAPDDDAASVRDDETAQDHETVSTRDDQSAPTQDDDAVPAQDERREPSKTERIMPWRSSRPVSRRARKAWAVGRNAEFAKSDAALAEQWQRTPAGEARNVVSGFAHGREMRLCDVGGVTLLALRRPVPSDEVLEFSRIGPTDLPEVGQEGEVLVSATDPELIHRIFDDRAHRVLREIPDAVTVAWAEGEWVLAAFTEGAGTDDWDAAIAPLAGVGDIARRLPPTPGSVGEIDVTHRDPTRPAPGEDKSAPQHLHDLQAVRRQDGAAVAGPGADGGADGGAGVASGMGSGGTAWPAAGVETSADEEPRWRPTDAAPTPVDLPSRSVPRRMGDGEFRDLGDSDSGLPALGEDPEHTRSRLTGGRIIRPDSGPAGIFRDGTPDAEGGGAAETPDGATTDTTDNDTEDTTDAVPTDDAEGREEQQ